MVATVDIGRKNGKSRFKVALGLAIRQDQDGKPVADIVDLDSYKAFRDECGWEMLELFVRYNFPEPLADKILSMLEE